VPGWGIKSDEAIKIAKLAVQTGLYPILEYTNGQLTQKSKMSAAKIPVEEYLKSQARFSHLFKTEAGKQEIAAIQQLADNNIAKYSL
jgi:pyruvate ferredoxin oxidoreductase beta subunit